MFGIIISGTLTSTDLVYKGWIAGLIGLWLSTIGQEQLQTFRRYTQDLPDLLGGMAPLTLGRILPEFRTIASQIPALGRLRRRLWGRIAERAERRPPIGGE